MYAHSDDLDLDFEKARYSSCLLLFQILDTPGLFDTDLSHEEIAEDVFKSLACLDPGPHAFLYVVSIVQRFTSEERKTFDRLKTYFGPHVADHMIVVFTNVDQLDEGDTITDFLEDASSSLKELLVECGQRLILLNNTSKDRKQVDNLIQMVDEHFGEQFFTNSRSAGIGEDLNKEVSKLVEEAEKNEVLETHYGQRLQDTSAADNVARQNAELAQEEAEEKTKAEEAKKQAAERAREEAEKKARAERIKKEEAERAREEAEKKARAERIKKEEAERAREEAEEKARAERIRKQEAERAREEEAEKARAERIRRQEAERAREEAERAREEAAEKARAEETKKKEAERAKEQAEEKARADRIKKQEAERAQKEAEEKARDEEAKRKAAEEDTRKERQSASNRKLIHRGLEAVAGIGSLTSAYTGFKVASSVLGAVVVCSQMVDLHNTPRVGGSDQCDKPKKA